MVDWSSRVLQNGFSSSTTRQQTAFEFDNRHQIMMDAFLLFCFPSSRRLAENPKKNIFNSQQFFHISFSSTACHLLYDWIDLVSYLLLFSCWSPFCSVLKRLLESINWNYLQSNDWCECKKAISWWSILQKLHQLEKSDVEMWYESSVLCPHERFLLFFLV